MVRLSVSSSSTLTVTFQEPQCLNSTVVTKYRGEHTHTRAGLLLSERLKGQRSGRHLSFDVRDEATSEDFMLGLQT